MRMKKRLGQPVAELLALHDVAAVLDQEPADTACTMPGRSGQERTRTKSSAGGPVARACAVLHHGGSSGCRRPSGVALDGTQSAIRNSGCASVRGMRNAAEVETAHRPSPARACSPSTGRSTILEVLARTGEAGVTEIAAELGVHKSTAFRLVATLEGHRLVEQTVDRGRYRLGVGILRLAGATTARLDLVQEARPICRQLAADTGETVNIAVLVRRARRSTSTRSPARRPSSRTTGSASTSRCTPPATARCC